MLSLNLRIISPACLSLAQKSQTARCELSLFSISYGLPWNGSHLFSSVLWKTSMAFSSSLDCRKCVLGQSSELQRSVQRPYVQLIPEHLEYEKRIRSEEIILCPKASCVFSLSLKLLNAARLDLWNREQRTVENEFLGLCV